MQKEVTVRWRVDVDGEGGRIGFVEREIRSECSDRVVMDFHEIGQAAIELRQDDLRALIEALQAIAEAK